MTIKAIPALSPWLLALCCIYSAWLKLLIRLGRSAAENAPGSLSKHIVRLRLTYRVTKLGFAARYAANQDAMNLQYERGKTARKEKDSAWHLAIAAETSCSNLIEQTL
jgi:hypothetical protein